jgi:hypothetical protein
MEPQQREVRSKEYPDGVRKKLAYEHLTTKLKLIPMSTKK